MPGHRIVHCKICGRHVADVGPLSARKRCQHCGRDQLIRNAAQLRNRQGPHYDRWLAAMVESVAKLHVTPSTPAGIAIDEGALIEAHERRADEAWQASAGAE